jgi:predicted Zn finger-like uncharacterized protein
MTIECPRCHTQYRLPEARINDPKPVFKCTRCSHVFSRGAERGQRGGTRKRDDERNLSFSFEDEEEALRGPALAQEADDEVPDYEEPLEFDEAPAPSRRAPGSAAQQEPAFVAGISARDVSREVEAPARRSRARFEREKEDAADELGRDDEDESAPLLVKGRDQKRSAPIHPRRGAAASGEPSRSPLRPMAYGIGAVVAAFLVLAAVLRQRPEAAIDSLSRVPLLGSLIGDDHLVVWRLQLADVEASVETIKGDRPAYVVSGTVLNTTNQSLHIIEIEGRLLSDGVEKRRETVKAGNQSKKTIRDLSPSEVEMLLHLEPNKRFVVRPGESVGFLIVFPDPPANTTEVSCRVIDAQTA